MALGGVRTAGRGEPVLGTSVVSGHGMLSFLRSRNPEFPDAEALVGALQILAPRYGIRGDVVLCQMLLETGNFRFAGSAVTPDQYNYGGLGVTRRGLRGESYPTVAVGVRAHLQHLHAYATPRGTSLPLGETLVDSRYDLVARGSAPRWDDLGGGRWAADPDYATKILAIYRTMLAHAATLPAEDEEVPAVIVFVRGDNRPHVYAIFSDGTYRYVPRSRQIRSLIRCGAARPSADPAVSVTVLPAEEFIEMLSLLTDATPPALAAMAADEDG